MKVNDFSDKCKHGHDCQLWGRTTDGTCRACIKHKSLMRNYGITLEEFIELYTRQFGRCAICGREFGSYLPRKEGWNQGSRIEVDHDHKKKGKAAVRGLLCGGRWAGCNRKLGRIDNIPWLRKVIQYLRLPPAQAHFRRHGKPQDDSGAS